MTPVTFSDLPMDVLEEVVRKLNVLDCRVLRNVSRDLRNLVDSMEFHCQKIVFHFELWYHEIFAEIKCDNLELTYKKTENGFCRVVDDGRYRENSTRSEISCSFSNFLKTVLFDFSTLVKNPKLKISHLTFRVYNNGRGSLFAELIQSLNFQMNVRSILIEAPKERVLPILQFMKPESLEVISIRMLYLTSDKSDEITETEQWKKAKCLHLNGVRGLQAEMLLHFKEIKIVWGFTDKTLFLVREILINSDHLESCCLGVYSGFYDEDDYQLFDLEPEEEGGERNGEDEERAEWRRANANDRNNNQPEEVNGEKEIVGQKFEKILASDSEYDFITRRYSKPNSRDYFQFKFKINSKINAVIIKKISGKR